MAKKKTAKTKAPAAAKANSVGSSDSTSSKGSNEENSTSVATTAAVEVETPAVPAIGTSTRATRSSTRLRRRESEAPTTASGESSPSISSPLSESFTAPVPKPTTARRTRASSVRGSKSRKETRVDEEEVASLNGEVSCDQGVNGVSVEHSVEDFANAQELPWFREKTSNFGTQQGPSNPQIQNGYLEEKPIIPKANNAFEQPSEEPPLLAEEASSEIRVKEEPTTQNSVSVKEERVDSVETIQQETSSAISPGEREESETIPAVNVKTELESDPVEEQTAEAVDEAVEDASGHEEITNYEEEQLPRVNGNVSGENGSRGEENTNFVSTTSLDEKPIIPKANYAILSQKVKQEPAEPEEEVACGETRPVDEVDFSKIQDDEIFRPVQMARIKVEGEVLENREEEAPDFDENGSMEVEPQKNGKKYMELPVSADIVRLPPPIPLPPSTLIHPALPPPPPPFVAAAPPPPPPPSVVIPSPIVVQAPPPPPPTQPSLFSALVNRTPSVQMGGFLPPPPPQLKPQQAPDKKARLEEELKRLTQQISFEKTLRQTMAAPSVQNTADPVETWSKMAEMWQKSAESAADAKAKLEAMEKEKQIAEAQRIEEEKKRQQKQIEEAKKKAAALLQTFAKQHEEHKVEAVVLAAAEPSTECPNSSETEASTESPAESPKPSEQGDENTKKEEEPKEKTTPKKDEKKTEKKSDSDRRRSRSRSRDRRRSRSPVRSPRRHRSRSRDRSRDRRRSRSRSYDRRGFKRSRSPGRRFGGRYSGRGGGYRGNHGRFGYRPDRRRSRSRSVDRRRRERRSRSRSYSKSPLRSLANSPEPNKDSKRISDASVEMIRPEEIPLPPPAPPAPEVTPEMPEYEEINELLYLDDEWGKNGKKLKRNYEKSSSCFCKQQGLDCSDSSCANRAMLMECPARCVPGCKNRNFSNKNYAPIEAFYTGPNKGWGVRAKALISKGTFITEYLGEVVTVDEFQKRTVKYAKDPKHKHHYIFELGKKLIDATVKGNCSRFINHSCEPNAVCYKWAVPKTPRDVGRIGFFAKADICPGEEITFDYQFCNYGKAQQCYCGAAKCKGTIGEIADAEGGSDVEEEESDETPSDLDDEEDKSEEERRKAEIRADNAHKKVTSILQLVSIPGSKMAMKAKILVREMLFLDEETDMKRRVISYLESSSDFFKIAKRAHLFDVFASWLSSSEWEHHDMYLKTEVIRLIGKQDTVDRTSGWTIPCCEAVEAIASMEMPDFLAARDVMSALLDQVASDGEVEMDGDSPAETYEEVFNQMRQEARDLMNNTNFEEVKRCCNVTKFKIPKKQQQQPRAAAGKESRDVSIVKQRDDFSYPRESRWGPNYEMPRFGRRFNRRRYDRFVPFSSNDRNFLPQASGPQRRIFFPDFSNSGRFVNRKRGFDEADQDMNGLSAKRQLPDLLSLPARVESPVEMELASTPEDSPKHSAIPVPQITPTNITTPFGLMSTPASSSKTSETATSTGTSAPPPPSVDIAAYHNWLKSYGNAAPSDGSHLFNLATTHLQTMDDKIAFYGALGDDLYNAYQDALEKELSYMKVALPKRLDAAYKRAQLVAEEEKKKLAMAAAPAPVVLTAPQIAPPPLEAPKKKKKEYMWIRARDPSDTSGEVYFFHKVTNETVWELPAGEEYDPMEPVVMFTSTGEVATAEPDSSSAVNEENRPDLASRLEEVFSEPPVSAKASSSSVGRPESRSDSRNHHHHHHVKDSAKKNLKISEEKLLKKFKAAIEAVVHPTVHALLKDVPSADESKTKWMAKLIAKEMTKRESARPDFDYVMHTANKERINHYAKKYLTRKIVDERCAELWKGYEHS